MCTDLAGQTATNKTTFPTYRCDMNLAATGAENDGSLRLIVRQSIPWALDRDRQSGILIYPVYAMYKRTAPRTAPSRIQQAAHNKGR